MLQQFEIGSEIVRLLSLGHADPSGINVLLGIKSYHVVLVLLEKFFEEGL